MFNFQMIKFIQSNQFINNDIHMYHSETNTPALARTSNLNEELGMVEMHMHYAKKLNILCLQKLLNCFC